MSKTYVEHMSKRYDKHTVTKTYVKHTVTKTYVKHLINICLTHVNRNIR